MLSLLLRNIFSSPVNSNPRVKSVDHLVLLLLLLLLLLPLQLLMLRLLIIMLLLLLLRWIKGFIHLKLHKSFFLQILTQMRFFLSRVLKHPHHHRLKFALFVLSSHSIFCFSPSLSLSVLNIQSRQYQS